MKFLSFLLILFLSFGLWAQENTIVHDTISESQQDIYIEDHKNQLNIKFDVSNDVQNYFIKYAENKVEISPNLSIRYALDFNYKFASLRIGIRAPVSDAEKENKGDSYVLRLRVKLLFDKWAHRIEYNYVRGYYIKNSENLVGDDFLNQLQFPRLKTYNLTGTTAYKFNENFSLRAVASQTEIQIKSAGSFMPSLDYGIYKIDGTKKIINAVGETIERDRYNNYQGFTSILNIGYYYTYVYKKYWYAHAYLSPGIGIDLYQVDSHLSNENLQRNYTNFVTSLQSGAAVGYSSQKFYFGLVYSNRSENENPYNNEFQFHSSRNIFHAFVGYRFKAPKPVEETIEFIEKQVPILERKND